MCQRIKLARLQDPNSIEFRRTETFYRLNYMKLHSLLQDLWVRRQEEPRQRSPVPLAPQLLVMRRAPFLQCLVLTVVAVFLPIEGQSKNFSR
ncbi:hypothetical protein Mapa_008283 [Marchantia paleacea]|nr:hypothetical protein Mapa_008283 [Marchantia paleacea]